LTGRSLASPKTKTPESLQEKVQRPLLALLHKAIALLTHVYRKTTGM
jgi:hypothetical protein